MTPPFVIHWRMFFPFLVGSTLFYLSSRYFGGIFIRIAWFWFLIYFLDIIILFINSLTLRFSQDFSSGHINKGEKIEYKLKLAGSNILPVPKILIKFTRIHQKQDENIPPQHIDLKRGGRWEFSKTIHTELRGVYTMGLSRLTLTSLTGLASANLSIWSRTFYIYPRVLKNSNPLGKHRPSLGGGKTKGGHRGDYHTFSGLTEYRPGMNLHLMSWPRYIQTGIPYLRTFETQGGSSIHIILDRRKHHRSPGCEDTAIETALALIYSSMKAGQRVMVHGFPGWERRTIANEEEFYKLHKTTLFMEFNSLDIPDFRNLTGSIYLISTLAKRELLDPGLWAGQKSAHLVAVTDGMTPEDQERVRILIPRLSMNMEVTEVPSNKAIEEVLECLLSS